MGLQEFKFETCYDIIWVQWVLCYLTDLDLVKFLKDSKENLVSQEHSIIFIKENVADGELPVFDESDNSMARSRKAFEELFTEAGFEIVSHEYQADFPKELFKVSIWALRPSK
jgi:hypothetical protein